MQATAPVIAFPGTDKPLWKKLLTPNAKLTKREYRMLGGGWAVLILAVWTFVHIPFVASPYRMFLGFKHLWFVDAFGKAAIQSIQLYLLTMALGVLAAGVLTALTIPPLFRPPIYWLQALRFAPIVVLNLFLLTYMGASYQLTFTLMVLFQTIALLPMFLESKDVIDSERYDHSRTIYKSEWKVSYETVLLGRAVDFFRNNKVNQSVGWGMLFIAESFDISGGGLGALMARKMKNPDLAQVMAIAIFCIGVGMFIYWSLNALERKLFPFAFKKAGGK